MLILDHCFTAVLTFFYLLLKTRLAALENLSFVFPFGFRNGFDKSHFVCLGLAVCMPRHSGGGIGVGGVRH